MKKVFYFLLAVCISLTFSCKKESNPTPAPPVITFESFTAYDAHSARFSFNFKDTDGDIGNEEAQQDTSNYDLYMRYYYKNYNGNYVTMYLRDPTQPANPLVDSTFYVYHIPYVTNNIKDKVLDGQIIIDMAGYKPYISDSTSNLRYVFWIYDRARHKSNVVTTPDFQTPTH